MASINIHTEADKITLSYKYRSNNNEWKDESYPVWLDSTSCNYGGNRAWFLCPGKGCDRRVAILYGAAVFACRHCHQLAYPCQRETAPDRALRRSQHIRKQLCGSANMMEPFPLKPKGMHWQTFERLSHQHNLYCIISLDGMEKKYKSCD